MHRGMFHELVYLPLLLSVHSLKSLFADARRLCLDTAWVAMEL